MWDLYIAHTAANIDVSVCICKMHRNLLFLVAKICVKMKQGAYGLSSQILPYLQQNIFIAHFPKCLSHHWLLHKWECWTKQGNSVRVPCCLHPSLNTLIQIISQQCTGAGQRKCPQELYIFFWPLVDQAGLNTFSHYFSDTTPTYCELFYLWLSDLKLLHVWSKRFKGVPLFWQRTPRDYNLYLPLFSLISKEWDVLTLWTLLTSLTDHH